MNNITIDQPVNEIFDEAPPSAEDRAWAAANLNTDWHSEDSPHDDGIPADWLAMQELLDDPAYAAAIPDPEW